MKLSRALVALAAALSAAAQLNCANAAQSIFNKNTLGYSVSVKLTWADSKKNPAMCTTCPYTCSVPKATDLAGGTAAGGASGGIALTVKPEEEEVPLVRRRRLQETAATAAPATEAPAAKPTAPAPKEAATTAPAKAAAPTTAPAKEGETTAPTKEGETEAPAKDAETTPTKAPSTESSFKAPEEEGGVPLAPSSGDGGPGLSAFFSTPVANGCCFADPKKLYTDGQPTCSSEANPPQAESCGFAYGPTIQYKLSKKADKISKAAVLFATTDCLNFWMVSRYPASVGQGEKPGPDGVYSVQVNKGCYGASTGTSMALVGCIMNSTDAQFSPRSWLNKTWTYKEMAGSCIAVGGKCGRTNNVFMQNLKCCVNYADDTTALSDDWDPNYKEYRTDGSSFEFSGGIIMAIVFGSAVLMVCTVLTFVRIRRRAKEMSLLRELEASEDYEEIITPLTVEDMQTPHGQTKTMGRSVMEAYEGEIDVDHDIIYREKSKEELLYEGDL